MTLSKGLNDREFAKFIERDDGQTAVAVDIESADQGGASGGGGNNTYYAKPSGYNADSVVAYKDSTTITVTGLPFTFTKYDISQIDQIPASGNVIKHKNTAVFSVSGNDIVVSDATFSSSDEFVVTFVGSPRTENTPSSANQVIEISPLSEQYSSTLNEETAQTDGTSNYYFDMGGFKGFSVQFKNTAGVAGTNTLKVYASNQDDGTASDSVEYIDITQYGMANNTGVAGASFTADVLLSLLEGLNVKWLKVEVVRSSDGGNNDGAWSIITKRWY